MLRPVSFDVALGELIERGGEARRRNGCAKAAAPPVEGAGDAPATSGGASEAAEEAREKGNRKGQRAHRAAGRAKAKAAAEGATSSG
eukprot:5348776-Alexandrium_andersonii.AAC.1